jgi:hypothetical protein
LVEALFADAQQFGVRRSELRDELLTTERSSRSCFKPRQ